MDGRLERTHIIQPHEAREALSLTGAGSGIRTRVCLVGNQRPYHLAMPANA